MKWHQLYQAATLDTKADALFEHERSLSRLDGWFLVQESRMRSAALYQNLGPELAAAEMLLRVVAELPLTIHDAAVFAGTQRDAFARTYALINPTFRVDSFEGYCDPLAVYNDIECNQEFTHERIEAARAFFSQTPYITQLKEVYQSAENDTGEIAYFVEQVTGHTIADFRPILRHGIVAEIARIEAMLQCESDAGKRQVYTAMRLSLEAAVKLAQRYGELARRLAATAPDQRAKELLLMAETLAQVPQHAARNLFEAMQSFIILWQVMCLEQSPNPYAFSAGNVDRIFEPYRAMDPSDRQTTAALFRHLLTFFNIGDRSWAISQNLMVGGRSAAGCDLTNETTYAVLDAFFRSNYPQPILSVKLHTGTPQALHQEFGKFLFTPGVLTPSFFNDNSMFEVLGKAGVAGADVEDYAIAGCQEPLIMGKDNANTTNSWLNLAKILELTLADGRSTLTGKQIGLGYAGLGLDPADPLHVLTHIEAAFYEHLEHFVARMVTAANGCSRALSNLPVPFLSALMGGIDSGIDMRDCRRQGTRYHGSGCLIHGLSVVADSFAAIRALRAARPGDAGRLLAALRQDFAGDEPLRQFLACAPKYGNNLPAVDDIACELATRVSALVARQQNYLGNPFRPDFSSPSTHLLYGYWVGATPDGRHAREMLGYGLDPLCGEATSGLGFRTLSIQKLPFHDMSGGYASHFGVDPKHFPQATLEEKGAAFNECVIKPLFFPPHDAASPFYLYVNVNTPETLRKVLANPKKYAPNGIYIMRIHGTFVNFLDLSPAIQNDIIKRLDPESTRP
jgi:formate C-acetyltransferase